MKTEELAAHFIHHSPGFYQDIRLPEVDNKHIDILKQAYQEIEQKTAFREGTFRNWKAQSDLSVPAQITFGIIRAEGLVPVLLKYIYKKLFRRLDERFLLSSLKDDIAIIESLGAKRLLIENPVHLTPGGSCFYCTHGTSVNLRWLRYVYLLQRIIEWRLLPDDGIWVDVGCFYGGLQGLVRKYFPKCRMVLVDFHHQLCRSFIYLSQIYPRATHVMPDNLPDENDTLDIPDGAIMYVPVSEFHRISNRTVDLVTNFFSLGEMRRKYFRSYMSSQLFALSRKVFLANRFVSAPHFEKTYDSDVSILDYLGSDRMIDYFDVFPMQHYSLIKRTLFGRESFRNISSPYFEMLSSNAPIEQA